MLGPRPYWFDERVQALSTETSLGAPSGHAQNAVVVWGVLAVWANRRLTWIAAVLLMFLIGLSRMYLGVHFPHDVLVGWMIGALLLLLILRIERLIKPWLEHGKPGAIIATAFASSLALILLVGALRLLARDWTLPEAWSLLAARVPDADPISPFAMSGVIATAASFFGMAAGGVLLRQAGWFDASGPLFQRLERYVIGLVGMLALYIGLGMILPDGDSLVPILLRYLRYTLVGLWISYLAPELFIRLKLAERPVKIGDPPLQAAHS